MFRRTFVTYFLYALWAAAQTAAPLRPPAVPLVTHDPYFSVWSMHDTLTAEPTKHWTGAEQAMTALARIDGVAYRLMGAVPRYAAAEAMPQVSRELTPTRTMYGFESAGVRIDLTFFTPALPHDLEVLSQPVTYVVFTARALDGRAHEVSVYFDASSQLAVNYQEQPVVWSRHRLGGMDVVRLGTTDQRVLARSGDNIRIDWGYLYLAIPPQQGNAALGGTNSMARRTFIQTGALPASDDLDPPAQTSRVLPVLAASFELGQVSGSPVSRRLLLAYDDLFSIEYFHRKLRPWWRRNGAGAADLLTAAAREYDSLLERARRFDAELTADLVEAGGARYAALAILAYRQTLAAHKLVADLDGTPLYFSKENFSNGCIGTVDVTYPSAPFFLLLNPSLLEAQLVPVFDYAKMPRWRWPYAPHDLGQYPLANGQVYGGGEVSEDRQMPVEESGNMLILTAALAQTRGNADLARRYWPLLTRWAEYLREKGMDPENQLSTDDFAGHLAHNTNLSLKAILALASYSRLAEMLQKKEAAAAYLQTAREMATRWLKMADDGDHYRLAFDKPGTWSQKYNLVWDKLLGFNLFPPELARREIAFYLTKQNKYGLPLDNRETYTKLDWILWTATLADKRADFEALADRAWLFANETPTRVPLTDWYWTIDGRQRGFQARSVVGGVYIKALASPSIWKKWSGRAAGGAK